MPLQPLESRILISVIVADPFDIDIWNMSGDMPLVRLDDTMWIFDSNLRHLKSDVFGVEGWVKNGVRFLLSRLSEGVFAWLAWLR